MHHKPEGPALCYLWISDKGVSPSEWFIHHTWMGFDPPSARTQQSTEWESWPLNEPNHHGWIDSKYFQFSFENINIFNRILLKKLSFSPETLSQRKAWKINLKILCGMGRVRLNFQKNNKLKSCYPFFLSKSRKANSNTTPY